MKVGSFESAGQNRLWAFDNEWAIDLNAAYRRLLTDKGQTDSDARATAEIPPDLISFIQHADISLSAAKEPLDYLRKGDYHMIIESGVFDRSRWKKRHRCGKIYLGQCI